MATSDSPKSVRRVRAISCLFSILAIGAVPSAILAQGVGVAPHVGTLGVGVDLAVSLVDRVGFRAGANIFPFDIGVSTSDVDYTIALPSPQFTVMADLFLAGSFRLTGGLLVSSADLTLEGDFTGTVDIGDDTYTAEEVGTLTGAIVTNDVSPYVGIGVGRVAGSGFGFLLDLGVAFQGTPGVALAADGPIASDPAFQADLEAERQDIEDDVDIFRYYPVITLGFSIGIG